MPSSITRLLLFSVSMMPALAIADEVNLDADDIQFIKTLNMRDTYIKDMSTMSSGLAELLKLIEKTSPAPVKIAIKWNQAQIAQWRAINSKLASLNKQKSCQDIELHLLDTDAKDFFDNLKHARGCD